MCEVQTFRDYNSGDEMTCRLLTVTGKSFGKTVRLYKAAIPILRWISPYAEENYLCASWNHGFPGDISHTERNHRVAEAAIMCIRAGIESRPYELPKLQNEVIKRMEFNQPSFYFAKSLKHIGQTEMNKTMFTRITGSIFINHNCYAVYNTRNAVMKWNGMGEFKTLHSLIEVARLNAGVSQIDTAILFGESYKTAYKTMLENQKNRRLEFRFDGIYRHIHFVPMNEFGIRLLKILIIPDRKQRLLDLLFEPECRSNDLGAFEYDAYIDGVYVLSFLDSDIARLMRFSEARSCRTEMLEVLCFPEQVELIKKLSWF
ncbi:MAG: hypothetical protein L6V93_02360 [Clostridiales bacterium]|nr:MAG: hypothetical protein L6V93_02360 [Clostridiales bacterium]